MHQINNNEEIGGITQVWKRTTSKAQRRIAGVDAYLHTQTLTLRITGWKFINKWLTRNSKQIPTTQTEAKTSRTKYAVRNTQQNTKPNLHLRAARRPPNQRIKKISNEKVKVMKK